MKSKLSLLIVLFVGSLVFLPAEAKKHPKEDVRGTVVTSVDAPNNKIVLTTEHNQQAITYQVPLGTILTIDGEPVSLAQIKKGMHVISYTDADANTLSQLDVAK